MGLNPAPRLPCCPMCSGTKETQPVRNEGLILFAIFMIVGARCASVPVAAKCNSLFPQYCWDTLALGTRFSLELTPVSSCIFVRARLPLPPTQSLLLSCGLIAGAHGCAHTTHKRFALLSAPLIARHPLHCASTVLCLNFLCTPTVILPLAASINSSAHLLACAV